MRLPTTLIARKGVEELQRTEWPAVAVWALILGFVGWGWLGASEIGLTNVDRVLAGPDGPERIRSINEGAGALYRTLSWPVIRFIETQWAVHHAGPLPLGLLLYALSGLLFGRAVGLVSGEPRVAFPVAIAFLLTPLSHAVFTSVGAATNFLLAGTIALAHALALTRLGDRGDGLLAVVFAMSSILSFLTYELSLFFIAASAVALDGWRWDRTALRCKGIAVAAVAVVAIVVLLSGEWTPPRMRPVRTQSVVEANTAYAVDYLRSRSQWVLPWLAEATLREAGRVVTALVAGLIAVLGALALLWPRLSRRGVGVLGLLLGASVLSPLIQPILVLTSLSPAWRVNAKLVVYGGAMGLAAILLLSRLRGCPAWATRAAVAVVLWVGLLGSSGVAHNLRESCRLPLEMRNQVTTGPRHAGIVRVDGRLYHLSFARRICREPGP